MSRRAVKFILDILDEQRKSHSGTDISPNEEMAEATTPLSPGREDETTIQDRIEQLLQDGRSFVNADDPDPGDYRSTRNRSVATDAEDDIAFEFTPQNTYHFRLIAPQIQLQSEKNQKSAVLVTAKGMQLKVVQIMDKDRVVDEISGLVQRRFTAAMDSLQMFVTSTRTFSTDYLHMYSGNRYGTKAGAYWPPWVPLEVMFEFQVNPYGFSRIVQRTSASLRYDKYNTLRLKYNNDVSGGEGGRSHVSSTAENRMDHLWIEFPQLRAICDSAQYYALYIIVMDLLLYNEPLEKTRSERLEKIMLASDFSDLTGAPEMVQMLQERIHQLEEIKMYFQVNEKYLDRQGWKDRIAMDQDLANCEDELFFMMKAITTSQRRIEDRVQREDSSTGLLRWLISAKEIAWHLIREKNESLLEFQIRDGLFDRTDYNDGSNYNCVNIGRVNGFNLLPNAIYPEIIAPYVDPGKGFNELHETKMLRVHWLMLEAIAGIPVVDYFEVDLVPLRVQLEREVAKRLFEYIFPGVGEEEDESGEQKDGEDQSAASTTTLAASSNKEHGMGTGAGTLEHRLTPTMALAEPRGMKRQKTGLGITNGSHSNLHHWSLLQHSNKAHPGIGRRLGGNMNSQQSLSVMSRTPSERSVAKSDSTNSHADNEKGKRGVRPGSGDKKKEKERSDDLTQMMSRASNYMTLSYVKIPSMVLCLSYKGRGQRNLEDVHDLVFRMPTLEYRNKTWSNLDLALQLKKDVIKALISHAGAIVGNKFKHQRSSKPQHNSRLREIINMSTIMSSSGEPSTAPSEESSLAEDMFDEPRQSFTSGRGSTLSRSVSFASGTSIAASMLPPPESEGTLVSHSGTPPPSRGSTKQHLQPPQQLNGEQEQRNRGSSISRHLTGLGQRLRQGTDGAPAEEAEESAKKKSKLLLGGQKLLRSLPHP
ncbi:Protein SABRE [Taxawa tesnikishii (nom. ined.)]|nr:Protein SABRE [Dothideales sp. JES 119]